MEGACKMKVTYQEWEKMSPEQQSKVTEDNLPEIPQAELQNGLTKSKMVLKDGQRMWEITVDGAAKLYPEFKQETIAGVPAWYKFNPIWGYYSLNLTDCEPTLTEEPLGMYAERWMEFMEQNHPHLAEELRHKRQFLTVARAVDEEARTYRELLDRQYTQANPRPTVEFEKIAAWETTRAFYTDGAVMRERVLIPRTAA